MIVARNVSLSREPRANDERPSRVTQSDFDASSPIKKPIAKIPNPTSTDAR